MARMVSLVKYWQKEVENLKFDIKVINIVNKFNFYYGIKSYCQSIDYLKVNCSQLVIDDKYKNYYVTQYYFAINKIENYNDYVNSLFNEITNHNINIKDKGFLTEAGADECYFFKINTDKTMSIALTSNFTINFYELDAMIVVVELLRNN